MMIRVFCTVIFFSCTSFFPDTKLPPVSYHRQEIKVDKLAILPSVCAISVIDDYYGESYNDSLSNTAFEIVSSSLKETLPNSLKVDWIKQDDKGSPQLLKPIIDKLDRVQVARNARNLVFDQKLLNNFDTSAYRFVFGIVHTGFIRNKKNDKTSRTVTDVARIATFGAINYLPYTSNSVTNIFIIDLHNQNLVYFDRSISPNRDPVSEVLIQSQFQHLTNAVFN